MTRSLGAVLAAVLVVGVGSSARADDKDAKAILDKAIKAIGGEEKLGKADVLMEKTKGVITFGDNDNEFSGKATMQGLEHARSEFEGEFGGNKVMGVTVVSGDKGWRKFGENVMELDEGALANEKRTLYLRIVPITIVPLKGKGFKVEAGGEEKVNDKPAAILKVTGPDGKDFTLSFDKEDGLPVKLVARVPGFNGEEFTQETTYASYKDFGGVKKATKVVSKRDGQKFLEQEVSHFKVRDKAAPDAFAEPK